MGFRTSYKLSDKATVSWMLVNGINQMEDFNGFKSNHFMLSTTPAKNVSWTIGYYFGQENRDTTPFALSNLPPALPTQPGLSTDRVRPTPNGRTHIADTYLSWNATPKLTLVGEADYIVSRLYSNSFPTHLAGGAGYVKYQFTPVFYLAGRFEYVSDRGGFSQRRHSSSERRNGKRGISAGGWVSASMGVPTRLLQSTVLPYGHGGSCEKRTEHRPYGTAVVVRREAGLLVRFLA